jgi:hypothetical protein
MNQLIRVIIDLNFNSTMNFINTIRRFVFFNEDNVFVPTYAYYDLNLSKARFSTVGGDASL